MSENQLNTTESNDYDNQFNTGIKMIINAYDNNNQILSLEVNRLNETIQEKNKKITELEELCSKLLNEKKTYENKLNSIIKKNNKLKNQLETISKENTDLKKIKQTIIETIDTNKINKTIEVFNNNINNNSNLNGGNSDLIKNTNKYNNKENELMNMNSNRNFKPFKYLSRKKIDVQNFLSERYKSNSVEKIKNNPRVNSINEIDIKSKNIINLEIDNYNNNKCNIFQKNDFFKKCRCTMNPSQYSDLMDIVRKFNSKEISKNEMYNHIIEKLKIDNYNNLIEDFNKLFS